MSKRTKSKKFSSFCIKRINSFLNNIYEIQISSNAKTIHNIRTDIKKLRSLFILTKMLDKKFKQSVFYRINVNILKRIFRIAGKIREAELILTKTDETGIPPEIAYKIKASVQKSLKSHRLEFADMMNGFENFSFIEIKKYYKKTGKKFREEKILLKCLKLFMREFKKIKSLIVINPSPENLHAIRKLLKNMCATGSLLRKVNHNKNLSSFLRICEKEEIKLGDWHDKIIFADNLRKVIIFKEINNNIGENEFIRINDEENNELLDSLYINLFNIFCNTYSKNKLKKFILSD